MMPWLLLAQQNDDAAGALGALCGVGCNCAILLVVVVPMIAGMWKVFEKAGRPGWGAIVPFYNTYLLTEIAGKDIIWFVMTLLPCVNIVAMVVICLDLAKRFGKDPIYGIGLAFLPFIFFPMLGFGDARYQGAIPPSPPAY